MAERRMFAKTIIDSDAFLDMPLSTQCLYFHLSMRADDEGFINNPRKIQRMVGAADDDMRLLIAKRFILVFESGVIVIKHWKIHNYIQKDRFKKTLYDREKKMIAVDEKGAYTECVQNGYSDGYIPRPICVQDSGELDTECIQDVSKMDTADTKCIQSVSKTDTECIQNVSKVDTANLPDTECVQNGYKMDTKHTENVSNVDTDCIQNGDTGKVRLGKDINYIYIHTRAREENSDSVDNSVDNSKPRVTSLDMLKYATSICSSVKKARDIARRVYESGDHENWQQRIKEACQ